MRRLAYSLALLGCLVPGVSYALGLGEIEVESALNQPLKARIELVAATPAEINSLRVKLASPEVFADVGLDRPFYLTELQFKPVVQDGKGVIEVTTRQNVREPFLNFLVEVSWSTGRLLREYTVLLDPPLFVEEPRQVPTQAPVVAPEPAPVPAPVARPEPIAPPPAAAAPAPTAPATMERLPTPTPAAPDGIAVQSGDTLWSLATQNRPDADVTVEQMMMAMLRANPEAFGNGNINNLKKGYVLRLPSREEIDGMTRSDAFDAVQEQHALWREYRAELAGDAVPQQVATEGAELEAAAPEDAADSGRLEIMGAGDAAGTAEGTVLAEADTAALEDELAVARQTLEARRQENEELQARVMELEQILSDKDRLLLLKDDELAELQARIAEQGEAVSEPVVVSDEVVEEPAEVPTELEPEPVAVEAVTEEVPTEEPAGQVVSEEVVEEPGEFEPSPEVTEAPTEEIVAEEPVVEEPTPPAPVVEPQPPVAAEPPRQPSFFEDLTSKPNFLAIAGIGVLLVVLVLVLIARRMRRGGEPEEVQPFEEPEVVATEGAEAPAMAGMAEPGGEEFAAGMAERAPEPSAVVGGEAEVEPVTGAAAPPEGELAGEEIESDDTTAEVDVYLAYGLHQQAEELLKGALESNPEKDVYRLKLLETYYATKDKGSFDSVAQELHDRLGGAKSLMWSRAVVMGQEISPDNPLFSGAEVSGLSASDFAPKRPESADIDLSLGEDLEPSPELDIGLDESEQPTGELPTNLDFGAAAAGGLEAAAEQQVDEALDSRDTGTAPQPGGVEETAEIEFDLSELDVSAQGEISSADEITDVNVEFGDEPETEEASSRAAYEPETEEASTPAAYEAETEEVELAPTSETMEVDVSDLDLSQATQETQELEAGIEGLGVDEEEGLIAGGDEVSTKLDLAKAYIDMGDSDGARSTLEEVIAEGNEEQRREAEELMNQIA